MRPIDADILKEIIGECPENWTNSPEEIEAFDMWHRIMDDIDSTPTVNDWVSVKDKLPYDQDIVIVAINDDSGDTPYKYTYFGWYMSEAKCWIVDDEIRRGEVYAWKPLPEPPEVSKNG